MSVYELIVVSVAFGVFNLIAAILIYKKTRSVHLNTFSLLDAHQKIREKEFINHFQQGQIVRILEEEMGLGRALPVTRGWAASPDFLLTVFRHAIARKPAVMVECSSGTSTLVLARAAEMNGVGHVYSLENDPVFGERTRQELARHNLVHRATILNAPLTRQEIAGREWFWYDHAELSEKSIDMIVIDGPPYLTGDLARYPAGPCLFPRLAARGAVFLDDADRPDEMEMAERWLAEFPDLKMTNEYCEKGCRKFERP